MTGLRLRLSQSRENWLALDIPPQVSADLAEPWALVVAVVGLGQVQPDVFHLPPQIVDAIQEWRASADLLIAFADARIDFHPVLKDNAATLAQHPRTRRQQVHGVRVRSVF